MKTGKLKWMIFSLIVLSLGLSPSQLQAGKSEYKEPLLVTDVGQGNSAKLLRGLLKRNKGILFTMEERATSEHLAGVKTVVIGVGASTKGLGAAGLDVQQELDRARELIDGARARSLPIIGIHIGGISRRGELSDRFVEEIIRNSDVFIAWQGGNQDGFIEKVASEHGIELKLVEKKTDVGRVLGELIQSSGE